jgi:ABC-type transport system involved in multi-copper enzyme maturation permease subunit
MSSTALTDPHGDGASRGPQGEVAPSLVRDDDLFFPRVIGVFASAAVIFGATALMLTRAGRSSAVGPAWASIILTGGLIGLLFHAAFDRDIQFRRVYMAFGYLALVAGGFLCVLPYPNHVGDQFSPGFLCMTMGLLFLLSFLRHEDDEKIRNVAMMALGAGGLVLAAVGLFGGLLKVSVLLGDKTTFADAPGGVMLALLGLGFLIACISIRGTSDEVSYRIALGIGAAGALVFVLALVASIQPTWIWFTKKNTNYFMPAGLLLQGLGLLYAFTALLIVSDNRFVVMTRRELAAYFYSPIFYMVLIFFAVGHWVGFSGTLIRLLDERVQMMGGVREPIIYYFVYGLAPVFLYVFGIPVLTMRLLSEEKRSGTIEVLLTSPVDETTIVMSKFFAAFIVCMLTWLPMLLLFVGLRINGNAPFDIRPLFSFGIALALTSAAGVGVGVLFSCLTKNQITAAVLTFVFMLAWTMVHILRDSIASLSKEKTIWTDIFLHVSYLDLWVETLQGKLVPRSVLFPSSLAIFSLFLSVKVLEARKWK